MTRHEFSEWLKHHCSRFLSVREKFASLPFEDKEEISMAWYAVLSRYSLDDATDASDRLFANADRAPRGFDQHPRMVKKMIIETRGSDRDLARTYAKFATHTVACPHCQDSGLVSVHARDTEYVEYEKRYGHDYASRVSLSTRCYCSQGDRVDLRLRRFNPNLDRVWQLEGIDLTDVYSGEAF